MTEGSGHGGREGPPFPGGESAPGREGDGDVYDGGRNVDDDAPEGAPGPSEAEETGVVDRADFNPDYDPDAPVLCEICGAVMEYTASCKLVCRNCGYTRDCSDP